MHKILKTQAFFPHKITYYEIREVVKWFLMMS